LIKVVCGILIHNDTILVGKRLNDSKMFPNKWEFPGGKIELNETPFQALKREWKEELEIDVHPFHQLRDISSDDIILSTFTLRLLGGKAKLNVHSEVKFVNKAEFRKMDMIPSNRIVGDILFNSYSIFLKKEK
tara:strand:- start:2780 stop:3178 length:399 start_codon:yes stop_codon:yes gene_type:complete